MLVELQLLPLLIELIICSTGSGIVIARTARYPAFPIVGDGADDRRDRVALTSPRLLPRLLQEAATVSLRRLLIAVVNLQRLFLTLQSRPEVPRSEPRLCPHFGRTAGDRELAEQVGMSESQAHEILRAAEIKPHLLEQWVISELGPDFDARAAELCGLCLEPPEGALVVSIDEKTGIQAKAPTRADLQPRPGRSARREYEYTRNGTQNLFAALRVHTGEMSAMPSKTRSNRPI